MEARMEALLEQLSKQKNIGFWIYTFCVINFVIMVILGYLKIRASWSTSLQHTYIRLFLLGVFPMFISGWIGMLGGPYDGIFVTATLYLMGVSLILVREHALRFLDEQPKMYDAFGSQTQLHMMTEIKEHPVLYLGGILFFFFMGTISLCLFVFQ